MYVNSNHQVDDITLGLEKMQLDQQIAPTGKVAVKSVIFRHAAFFNCMMPYLTYSDKGNFVQVIHDLFVTRIKNNQVEEKKAHIAQEINLRLTKRIVEFFKRQIKFGAKFNDWLVNYVLTHPEHPFARCITLFDDRAVTTLHPDQINALTSTAINLQSITLMKTKITKEFLSIIPKFAKVKKMILEMDNFDLCSEESNIALPQLDELEIFVSRLNENVDNSFRILQKMLPKKLRVFKYSNWSWNTIMGSESISNKVFDLALFPDSLESFQLSGDPEISFCGNWDRFKKLQELSLGKGNFTDKELKNLPSTIHTLHLSNCDLYDEQLTNLSFLDHLQTLNLSFNTFLTSRSVSFLPKSIIQLDCDYCAFKDEIFSVLQSHTNLQYLSLNHNVHITGVGFSCLNRNLKELTLEFCPSIKNQGLLELKEMNNLRLFQLSDNDLITDFGFSGLPSSLAYLILRRCPNISDTICDHLLHLFHLTTLNLINLPLVEGKKLKQLPKSLQELHIHSCSLQDESLTQLVNFKKLLVLTLNKNKQITDEGIAALPESIEVLDLSDCEKITDAVFTALSKFKNLHTLRINNNASIKGDMIHYLPTSVQILELVQTNLTNDAMTYLQKRMHLNDVSVSKKN